MLRFLSKGLLRRPNSVVSLATYHVTASPPGLTPLSFARTQCGNQSGRARLQFIRTTTWLDICALAGVRAQQRICSHAMSAGPRRLLQAYGDDRTTSQSEARFSILGHDAQCMVAVPKPSDMPKGTVCNR